MKRTPRSLVPFGSKSQRIVCGLAAAVLFLAFLPAAGAQNFGYRNLRGKVLGENGKPVNGAVVYLSNSRNSDIRTFISTDTGTYLFAGLADDTNYTVWAAFEGRKSPKRVLSSFDQRKEVHFDLHIPPSAQHAAKHKS